MARDALAHWAIRLPYAKPPLGLNDRPNRWRKAELVAAMRGDAFYLVKHHRVPKGLARVRMTLIYCPRDSGRRDAINLAFVLKSLEDGVVQARIIKDDTLEFIDPAMPYVAPPTSKGQPGAMWLLIEQLA